MHMPSLGIHGNWVIYVCTNVLIAWISRWLIRYISISLFLSAFSLIFSIKADGNKCSQIHFDVASTLQKLEHKCMYVNATSLLWVKKTTQIPSNLESTNDVSVTGAPLIMCSLLLTLVFLYWIVVLAWTLQVGAVWYFVLFIVFSFCLCGMKPYMLSLVLGVCPVETILPRKTTESANVSQWPKTKYVDAQVTKRPLASVVIISGVKQEVRWCCYRATKSIKSQILTQRTAVCFLFPKTVYVGFF